MSSGQCTSCLSLLSFPLRRCPRTDRCCIPKCCTRQFDDDTIHTQPAYFLQFRSATSKRNQSFSVASVDANHSVVWMQCIRCHRSQWSNQCEPSQTFTQRLICPCLVVVPSSPSHLLALTRVGSHGWTCCQNPNTALHIDGYNIINCSLCALSVCALYVCVMWMYVKCHSMFHPCCFRYGARSPLVSTGPLPIPPRVERERVCFVWLCVGGPSRVNRFIGHRATENSQLHCSSVDDDNSLVATPNAMMSNLPNPLSLRSVYKWDAERIRLHTCRCNSMLKSCQPIRVYKYVLCGGTGGERTTE